VVAAFEKVIGRPVRVHSYNRISAPSARRLRPGRDARHVGPAPSGACPGSRPSVRSFECARCSNSCQVNVIESARAASSSATPASATRAAGRGGAPVASQPRRGVPVAVRGILRAPSNRGPTMGIPRASTLLAHLPFWATSSANSHASGAVEALVAGDACARLRHLPFLSAFRSS